VRHPDTDVVVSCRRKSSRRCASCMGKAVPGATIGQLRHLKLRVVRVLQGNAATPNRRKEASYG
jgi:hypothetical protein